MKITNSDIIISLVVVYLLFNYSLGSFYMHDADKNITIEKMEKEGFHFKNKDVVLVRLDNASKVPECYTHGLTTYGCVTSPKKLYIFNQPYRYHCTLSHELFHIWHLQNFPNYRGKYMEAMAYAFQVWFNNGECTLDGLPSEYKIITNKHTDLDCFFHHLKHSHSLNDKLIEQWIISC